LRLIWFAVKNAATNFLWNMAWKYRVLPECMHQFASREWSRRQNEFADIAGDFVSASGWGGVYCEVRGQLSVLTIKPIEENAPREAGAVAPSLHADVGREVE